MAIGDSTKKIPNSIIGMESKSWDTVREVLVREILTANPISGAAEVVTGIQGNYSLALGYDGDGNVNQIQKTVGATTYTKSLTWTGGRLTAISVWS